MVEQVAGWNDDAYRAMSEFAHGLPESARVILEIGTEAGLFVFALLFAANWWRARRMGTQDMALAVLGPIATVAAYAISEMVKLAFSQPRPCAVMPDVNTLAGCPSAGDWSFPSNHATIVAASAIAVILARPGTRVVAVPVAVALGLSRILVGVHYPMDVMAGFALGTIVVTALAVALSPAARLIVDAMRGNRRLWPLVADRPSNHLATALGQRPGAGPRGRSTVIDPRS